MKPQIKKIKEQDEFSTPERCYILENWNNDSDDSVSIARARVEKGVTTQLHKLVGCVERYLIVSGKGIVNVGELNPIQVESGDVVVIPEGTSQKIQNVGYSDLVFYCICTPRYKPEYYYLLE